MINIIDGEFMWERTTIDLDGSEKKRRPKIRKALKQLEKETGKGTPEYIKKGVEIINKHLPYPQVFVG